MGHEKQHINEWWNNVKFRSSHGAYDKVYLVILIIVVVISTISTVTLCTK